MIEACESWVRHSRQMLSGIYLGLSAEEKAKTLDPDEERRG